MKTRTKILFLALPVACLALTLTLSSCGTLDKALLTQQTTVTPPSTNAVTGVVTPGSTNVTLIPKPNLVADTNLVSSLPIPYAVPAGLGLGWLLQAYCFVRQKKLSTALVTGIEAGRKILQQTPEGQALDAKVKDALIEHQDIAGVLNAASAMVNSLTANTVQTPPTPAPANAPPKV